MMKPAIALIAIGTLLVAGCDGGSSPKGESSAEIDGAADAEITDRADVEIIGVDDVAKRFVRLALGIGLHDKAFVDAYHGPEEWRDEVSQTAPTLDALESEAQALIEALDVLAGSEASPRLAMLQKNAVAALTRIAMARGETFSFNDETQRLYDATAPDYDLTVFDAALEELDTLLPGDAPLHERVDEFRASLAIPNDKLEAVFAAAIDECRRRALVHFNLPASEHFTTGFVTDKPWGGYNWYQGDFESLIEVNTDLPVIIDRAVDLGCHEGYPGHHTWNVLIERDLLNQKGWIEYSVYPLFSPQSLIAEGSANYGIELAFPGDEKMIFERDVLFPLAGLNPEDAPRLAAVNKAARSLSHGRNHIARALLDGKIDKQEAIALLMRYGPTSQERAEKSISFIETYRGYVINYNLGQDLVREFVEARVAIGDDPWVAFKSILTTPTTASDLKDGIEQARAKANAAAGQ